MNSTLIRFLLIAVTAPWWMPVARALWLEAREILENEGLGTPRRQSPGAPLRPNLDAPRGLVHKPRLSNTRDREAQRRSSGLAAPKIVRKLPGRGGF